MMADVPQSRPLAVHKDILRPEQLRIYYYFMLRFLGTGITYLYQECQYGCKEIVLEAK